MAAALGALEAVPDEAVDLAVLYLGCRTTPVSWGDDRSGRTCATDAVSKEPGSAFEGIALANSVRQCLALGVLTQPVSSGRPGA